LIEVLNIPCQRACERLSALISSGRWEALGPSRGEHNASSRTLLDPFPFDRFRTRGDPDVTIVPGLSLR
jgi:hypothetical protein